MTLKIRDGCSRIPLRAPEKTTYGGRNFNLVGFWQHLPKRDHYVSYWKCAGGGSNSRPRQVWKQCDDVKVSVCKNEVENTYIDASENSKGTVMVIYQYDASPQPEEPEEPEELPVISFKDACDAAARLHFVAIADTMFVFTKNSLDEKGQVDKNKPIPALINCLISNKIATCSSEKLLTKCSDVLSNECIAEDVQVLRIFVQTNVHMPSVESVSTKWSRVIQRERERVRR